MAANLVSTHPEAPDPRLRGRLYPVPFRRVWGAALATASGSEGWTVRSAEPGRGVIWAEVRAGIGNRISDLRILVSLDPTGLTRVDVAAAPRDRVPDFGAAVRRIARFLGRLDEVVVPSRR